MSQIPIQPVIVARTKSVALSIPAFIITFGHAGFIIWPLSMIWGAWAAHRYNQRLLFRAGI